MRVLLSVFTLIIVGLNVYASESINDVKMEMIKQSINNYSGNCPCPYNTTKRGRRCGKRSAYSRPGGASPLCYKSDISDKAAKKFLKNKQ